ncbi:MAG TPA: hypothetical protein PJ982_17815 [Lacipirellulaceae bacterium]|nr:hypothetical protein [Lacipirellulaceae bacterium]
MIAVAALLLPALARGKASAKSAACKSNLRQLGLALQMYVDDHGRYSVNGAAYLNGTFSGIQGTGLNWLNPYAGDRRGVTDSLLFLSAWNRTTFSCPAIPFELARG